LLVGAAFARPAPTRERTTLVQVSAPQLVTGPARVLDGGLATELEYRGYDLSSSLWSARLLIDNPGAIRDVHRAYFAAGAEIATAASYQGSLQGFAGLGVDGAAMLRRSVQLARQARDAHGSGWVAASVGPYGAVLADGSEYRGDYGLSVSELRRFHRPRLEILADAGPDMLAVETIPSLTEAEALVAELEALQVPSWFSFTVSGKSTRAGEPLADAFSLAGSCSAVFAVGVNCSVPGDVLGAIESAVGASGKPAVAYPNSGESWDAAARRWVGPSGFAPDQVAAWVDAGARLVGGCCRVGPAAIAALADRVRGRP
jgi:homocysteine S-methyltransferase